VEATPISGNTVNYYLLTRNKAGAFASRNPPQQPGEGHVGQIYKLFSRLSKNETGATSVGSTSEENTLSVLVKEQAGVATQEDALLQAGVPRMNTSTLNIAQPHVATGKGIGKQAK
jgi:hypothetical protein